MKSAREKVEEWEMRKENGRRLGVLAVAMTTSCFVAFSAWGAPGDSGSSTEYNEGPASNLWLTVVETASQARISVTVPTSYGFVVVGSVEPTDSGSVTSENGKVLLPNVRVNVTNPSTGPNHTDGEYVLSVDGPSQVLIKNYSTDVPEDQLDLDNPQRFGIGVKVRPYVQEIEQFEALPNVLRRHYWKPVTTGTDPSGDAGLFKYYRLGMNGMWCDIPGSIKEGGATKRVYSLDGILEIPAPPDLEQNGWTAGGTALVPYIMAFDMDVQVGGIQNQYKQVEESVRVGQIGWQIVPDTWPDPSPGPDPGPQPPETESGPTISGGVTDPGIDWEDETETDNSTLEIWVTNPDAFIEDP